jgi:hypothetical protein
VLYTLPVEFFTPVSLEGEGLGKRVNPLMEKQARSEFRDEGEILQERS